ncbi:MAG: integron [Alphaproteobacteria bacterium]|nr:integron [Alphaproteobacteria bacterium]
MFAIVAGLVASWSVSLPTSSHAGDSGVAVKVGGEIDLVACGSEGEVYRLNPDGDNFLAVRIGPGSAHPMKDKLTSKTQVYMCDQNGAWVGIVYGPDDADCGVSSPIAERQSYAGACASGWVHGRYIKLIAG